MNDTNLAINENLVSTDSKGTNIVVSDPELNKSQPKKKTRFFGEPNDDYSDTSRTQQWEECLYKYKFNPKIFVKFLIFYLLFFAGFGLFFLIFRTIRRSKLLHNMTEISTKGDSAFKFILVFIIPCLYFAYFTGYLQFQYAEVYMLIATLVFIAVSQASLIAYTHERIRKDLMMNMVSQRRMKKITSLGKLSIKEELRISILRLNIDISLLYFNFLGEKPDGRPFMPKSSSNDINLRFEGVNRHSSVDSLNDMLTGQIWTQRTLFDKTKSYGETLALQLIENFESKPGNSKLFLAFLQSLIPVVYQAISTSRPDKGDTFKFVLYIVLIIALWFINFFCAYYVMDVLNLTLVNLKRRVFLMQEMGELISPKIMKKNETPKLYHLDIFDAMTLRTWISIRKIFMHYGDREMKTMALSITLVMGFHIIIIIVALLHYFTGFLPLSPEMFTDYTVIFGLGSLVYFFLLSQLVFNGASLNQQYSNHKELLHENKSIVTSLIRLYPYFMADEPLKPQTYIYTQGLKKIKEQFGKDSTNQQREEVLHVLMETYDELIEDLNFDEVNKPFELMGIPVTRALTKSLVAGIFSLIIAVIPKLFSKLTTS